MLPYSRRWGLCAGCVLVAMLLLFGLGVSLSRARIASDLTRITVASDSDRDSQRVKLSGNGRLVVFDSDSDLLGQGITDDQVEVWLYDTSTMTFTRVTTASHADRDSRAPAISSDGSAIAFESDADFFGQGIPQGQREVWLVDTTALTLTRVTTASAADRDSFPRTLSADGTLVAIESDSDILGESIPDDQWEIWLYDAELITYTRVTTASDANRDSTFASLNADGSLLAFSSDSDFLGQGIEDEQSEIWLYDVGAKVLTRVTFAPDSSRNSYAPCLSADGTKLAFTSDIDFFGEGIPQQQYEVWLYDVASGDILRVTSTPSSGGLNDFPTLSEDGSRVAFHSDADFLGQGIPNSHYEVWLFDVSSSVLSRVTFGSEPYRSSRRPSLNADANLTAFQSSSDFLGQGIVSGQTEIWMANLPGPTIRLDKKVDDVHPLPGQRITYTLQVVNPLSGTLTEAVVRDKLHPWLDLAAPVSLDPPQAGAVLAQDASDLPVLASNLSVDAGAAITLSFPVTVSPSVPWNTVITNTAVLTSTQVPTSTLGKATISVLFRVMIVNPPPNSTDAGLGTELGFDAVGDVDGRTVSTATFSVHAGFQGRLDGLFGSGSVTFDPDRDLLPGEQVEASVTAGVHSRTGHRIVPYVWRFRAASLGGSGHFITHPVTPTLPAFQNPDVALGDLDADGDLDAVLTSSQADSVWLNDGAGGLYRHPITPTFGSHMSIGVALGDIDGDGDLDTLIASALTDTVWLNDGAGGLSPHPARPDLGTSKSQRVSLGDLDGDGDLDAVFAHSDGPNSVWLNKGDGRYVAHGSTPGFGVSLSSDVELGDLDQDGDLDALTVSRYRPAAVWLNDGVGNLRFRANFGAGASSGLALGDLDGDGDLDAVVAISDQPQTVWINDGAGLLVPHPDTPGFGAGNDSRDVALADLDGDGDLDVIVVNADQQPQTVWMNDGTGTFSPPYFGAEFGAGESSSLDVGDLDGDGDLDVIVGDISGADASVWINRDAYVVMVPLMMNGSATRR